MDITELGELCGQVQASRTTPNDHHVAVGRERALERRRHNPVLWAVDTGITGVIAIEMKLHTFVRLIKQDIFEFSCPKYTPDAGF